MSLTERENMIAGFAFTAGCVGFSLSKMIERLTEAEAHGYFDGEKAQQLKQAARAIIARERGDGGAA